MGDNRSGFARAGALLVGRRESGFAGRTLRLAAVTAALSFAFSLAGPAGTQPAPGPQVRWLDQGWTADQRERFHHQSQGTATLPIPAPWFLALQQPDLSPSTGLFSDPAYLDRFGFIPSPRDATNNADGLPIGFARTVGTDPRDGSTFDRIGFTCAACHTGRIDYGQTEMVIDGGPALIDLGEFGGKLAAALAVTDTFPTRFNRFADRVVGPGHPIERAKLHAQLHQTVLRGLGELFHDPGGTKEGFGRLDALNRIGNKVFGEGMGIGANNAPTSAPVAFPHIWDTSWFDWVQYNGSIEQPMVRNTGEAMGVGALVNFKEGPSLFASSIPVGRLHDNIEQQLAGPRQPLPDGRFSGLRSPAWPEDILPPINRALLARGAAVYRDRCQGCHGAAPGTAAFWTSNRWLPANAAGERYLRVPLIPIAELGTDPAQAQGMRDRTVLAPPGLGLTGELGTKGGYRIYSYGPALGQVVAKVVAHWYDTQTPPISPADRDRLNGYRPNGIRAELSYKARPLDGIWATAPYLHNGSVPTLWDLLSPRRERNPTGAFHLGNRQFDPRRVGYAEGGPFQLQTNVPGNRDTGHLFDAEGVPGRVGPTIAEPDRWALIEFLKTL
jgi:hypothetical protein